MTQNPDDPKQYLNAYSDYARTLRLWLVAYGVGTPAFFVSEEWVWVALNQKGYGANLLAFFALGVISQIALAFVNKYSMWFIYRGEQTPHYRDSLGYRIACTLSDTEYTDIACDVFSIVCFCVGTYYLLAAI